MKTTASTIEGNPRMKTKQLAKMIEAGQALARVMGNDRWEWQTAHTFLFICAQGGEVPMQEIEKQLDWGQSTVSRNVAKLGDGVSPAEPGARLIKAEEDPYWRRRKLVRLTEKGKRFAEELATILEK